LIAALLIAAAVAAALLAAASLRLPSLVSTLLAAYVFLAGGVVFVVIVLSPFRWVTRGGLGAAEAVLLAAAAGAWWLHGRPGLPIAAGRAALRAVLAEPATAFFLGTTLLILVYELLLVLTVPPNNTDALVYHLPRVAAWVQHHGYFWIPNAPTDRINEFQPLGEQEIFFLFVATGKGALFSLPQYVAELAILLAVYGLARRLGFGIRAAACSAFLLATFSLFELEATTAQNDLVAASFPVAAACLILSGGGVELTLAGAAAALGVGAKLTTALVWPVLAVLLWRRGAARALAAAAGGAVAGFVLVGMWGFVLNQVHTGHVLGHGGGRVEWQASPGWPDTIATALHVVYRTFDLSVLSYLVVRVLAGVGVAVAVVVWLYRRRLRDGVFAGLPFLAPLLTIGGANALAWVTARRGIPVHVGGWAGGLNRGAVEDSSAFGPVGAVFLLGAPFVVVAFWVARRVDIRRLALGLAIPAFLLLFALQSKWNPWETRFLIAPAALTAPLLAGWFRSRLATVSLLSAATIVGVLALVHDVRKPFSASVGHPWQLSWQAALTSEEGSGVAPELASYERFVPPRACIGAVAGVNETTYLLFGPTLAHRVYYLPVENALFEAYRHHLSYVVVSTGPDRWAAGTFTKAGWKRRMLGTTWFLLTSPTSGAKTGDCLAA
jgi:hypothetical protein